jgi:hypothetical protein
MHPYDWELPPRYPVCPQADSFHRTAREAIFRQLSGTTTPEQFQAAQESLDLLRAELEQQLHWTHFGLSVGTHRCVNDLYHEASARLRSLAIVQPAPQPAPPPPMPKPRSLRDVVADFAGMTDVASERQTFSDATEEDKPDGE